MCSDLAFDRGHGLSSPSMMHRGARWFSWSLAAAIVGLALGSAGIAEAQVTGMHLDKMKTPFVDRSLVLPEMWVTGQLDASFTHIEFGTAATNGGWIDIGGAFGILDDLEVEAALISIATEEGTLSPIGGYLIDGADWGMSRLGVTFRFLATDVVEMGGRFRFLIDNNATMGFNGALPILLHAGGIFRLDTGVGFIGRVPTNGGDPSFGLIDVNTNPSAPEAGIPLRMAFQAMDELWFGLNTGFGVGDVSTEESIFLPLGATIGGTVPIDPLLLDISGSFNFPTLFQPAAAFDELTILSELWQVGLSAKAHFGLPK
jgi:hypothetical protein